MRNIRTGTKEDDLFDPTTLLVPASGWSDTEYTMFAIFAAQYKPWSIEKARYLCMATEDNKRTSAKQLCIHVTNLYTEICKGSVKCRKYREKCTSLNECIPTLYRRRFELCCLNEQWICHRIATILKKYDDNRAKYQKRVITWLLSARTILYKDMVVYIAKIIWKGRVEVYK